MLRILFMNIGMREGWSSEQVEISASVLGLSQRTGMAMRQSWEAHSSELNSSLLSKIISANQLVDVDWSFGVTASTEDCDKVSCSNQRQYLIFSRWDEHSYK